jgi:hypothetical protein
MTAPNNSERKGGYAKSRADFCVFFPCASQRRFLGSKNDLWCDTELKLYDYIAAATWRGALVAMPMLAAQRLKRWIKQTPAAWNAFSAARSSIGSLARRVRG